jgi:hypothetical protein
VIEDEREEALEDEAYRMNVIHDALVVIAEVSDFLPLNKVRG